MASDVREGNPFDDSYGENVEVSREQVKELMNRGIVTTDVDSVEK